MKNFAVLLLTIIVIMPYSAGAHADGKSFEGHTSSGVSIDMGYSELPLAGASTTFDFSVRDAKGEALTFDRIWIRLSKDSSAYLATGISKAAIGKTVLTYRFPEAGAYEMEVRFEKAGESVAEHTFVFTAEEAESTPKEPFSALVLLSIVAAFLLGGIITHFFFPRTR